jgi:hypothetical protein
MRVITGYRKNPAIFRIGEDKTILTVEAIGDEECKKTFRTYRVVKDGKEELSHNFKKGFVDNSAKVGDKVNYLNIGPEILVDFTFAKSACYFESMNASCIGEATKKIGEVLATTFVVKEFKDVFMFADFSCVEFVDGNLKEFEMSPDLKEKYKKPIKSLDVEIFKALVRKQSELVNEINIIKRKNG